MTTQPSKAKKNTMLVLTRKPSEKIVIGRNITVTILKSANGSVSVGIEAPRDVTVNRAEVEEALQNGRIAKPRNPILRAALVAGGSGGAPSTVPATVH